MINTAFSPWPSFSSEEADAVSRVLLSNKVNYWTGNECQKFEREFAAWVGCKYAVALSNGTAALELALKVLGVGGGNEVIVTPRSFFASASCVITVGATPIFADVDQNSQCITSETIRPMLTERTKAIICVHLAGWPCDMDSIMELAEEKGLYVIEDCAQAHGARYKGRSVGSIGHLGAWSFCQDKIMTTGGEGGMLTTNRQEWWSKAWSYKDHGKSWSAVYESFHPPGFRWLHESFGTNLRMTEMQAVIGRIQLKKILEWHNSRTHFAETIRTAARSLPGLRVPDLPAHVEHAWYKCYLFVRPERLGSGWSRDRIVQEINQTGVPCYMGTCPEVYLEKAFRYSKFCQHQRLPIAMELGETSLMFLVHPTLTQDEIRKTCKMMAEVVSTATG